MEEGGERRVRLLSRPDAGTGQVAWRVRIGMIDGEVPPDTVLVQCAYDEKVVAEWTFEEVVRVKVMPFRSGREENDPELTVPHDGVFELFIRDDQSHWARRSGRWWTRDSRTYLVSTGHAKLWIDACVQVHSGGLRARPTYTEDVMRRCLNLTFVDARSFTFRVVTTEGNRTEEMQFRSKELLTEEEILWLDDLLCDTDAAFALLRTVFCTSKRLPTKKLCGRFKNRETIPIAGGATSTIWRR